MKNRMLLQLFEDGGGAGSGDQSGNAGGSGNGGQRNSGGNNATYSYEQAEEIANARAERAERSALKSYFQQQGMTEQQVNDAIRSFKEKQSANKPDYEKIQRERDDALKEVATMKNEKTLAAKGVKSEDMDYVMFKVTRLVDDKTSFEKAADKFLKENPRYTGKVYRVSTSSAGSENGSGGTSNSSINDMIRAAARR